MRRIAVILAGAALALALVGPAVAGATEKSAPTVRRSPPRASGGADHAARATAAPRRCNHEGLRGRHDRHAAAPSTAAAASARGYRVRVLRTPTATAMVPLPYGGYYRGGFGCNYDYPCGAALPPGTTPCVRGPGPAGQSTQCESTATDRARARSSAAAGPERRRARAARPPPRPGHEAAPEPGPAASARSGHRAAPRGRPGPVHPWAAERRGSPRRFFAISLDRLPMPHRSGPASAARRGFDPARLSSLGAADRGSGHGAGRSGAWRSRPRTGPSRQGLRRCAGPAWGRRPCDRAGRAAEARRGAGCMTPSTSTKVSRATLCGCSSASLIVSTGAKQTSVPSMIAHHSSRVFVLERPPPCAP